MTLEERLEQIKALLAVLVDRQTVREWYTIHEFAKAVGKSPIVVNDGPSTAVTGGGSPSSHSLAGTTPSLL